MVSHKFSSGQTVQARKNPWAALAGAYEIVCRLPVSGGDKQYWVKSLENGDHRVVKESDLVVEFPGEGALAPPPSSRAPEIDPESDRRHPLPRLAVVPSAEAG